jgi:hypothetical protein
MLNFEFLILIFRPQRFPLPTPIRHFEQGEKAPAISSGRRM